MGGISKGDARSSREKLQRGLAVVDTFWAGIARLLAALLSTSANLSNVPLTAQCHEMLSTMASSSARSAHRMSSVEPGECLAAKFAC